MINLKKLNTVEPHIIKATAEYSGSGIYLYYATMSDGRYILTSDECGDAVGCIEFFDADPIEAEKNGEEIWCEEWTDAHRSGAVVSAELWNELIHWIIDFTPKGNFLRSELEERLIKVEEPTSGFATDSDVVTFKTYANNLVGCALGRDDVMNQLCKDGIQITFGEKTLKLYFGADNFNALDDFLESVMEYCEQ